MNILITIWLNSLLHSSNILDQVVYALAEYSIFAVATIFVLAFVSRNSIQIFHIIKGGSVALGAWVISQGVNAIAAVPRPFVYLGEVTPLFTHGFNDSFPSGHAVIMFVLAFYLYRQNSKIGLVLIILAIAGSVARVTAGIHWPTDILGSIILAYVGVLLVEWIYDKLKRK